MDFKMWLYLFENFKMNREFIALKTIISTFHVFVKYGNKQKNIFYTNIEQK